MIVIVNWCDIKFNWTNAFDFLTVICVEGSSLSNLKHIHLFLLLHTPYLHLYFYEDVYSYFLCSPTAKPPQFLNNVFLAYEELIQFPKYEQIWKEIGKEGTHTRQQGVREKWNW